MGSSHHMCPTPLKGGRAICCKVRGFLTENTLTFIYTFFIWWCMVRNVREGLPFMHMGNLGHPGHPTAPLPPSGAVITDYNGFPRFNRVTQRINMLQLILWGLQWAHCALQRIKRLKFLILLLLSFDSARSQGTYWRALKTNFNLLILWSAQCAQCKPQRINCSIFISLSYPIEACATVITDHNGGGGEGGAQCAPNCPCV